MRVVDLHVHAFPDKIAGRRGRQSREADGLRPRIYDGTLDGLRESMARNGVERAVVQPVATRPESVAGINDWAARSQDERVTCFGAMHPDHPEPAAEIERLAALGLRGIKLHPEFQAFRPDEDRMAPIYEALARHDLAVFFHAGADIALDTVTSTPAVFARVLDAYPDLRVALGHMGGWQQWDEVLEVLAGRDVVLDTSFTLRFIGADRFLELVRAHGADARRLRQRRAARRRRRRSFGRSARSSSKRTSAPRSSGGPPSASSAAEGRPTPHYLPLGCAAELCP